MGDAQDDGPDKARVARAYYDKLRAQQRVGKAAWWSSFEVVMFSATEVKIKCLRCLALLSASNPPARAPGHLGSKACVKACAMATEAAAAAAKVEVASGTMRRGWGQTAGRQHFPLVSKVAVKLLSFHATACATERNWSLWGLVYPKCRSNLALERGEKLVFMKGNDKSAAEAPDEEVMLTLLDQEA
jgi:hypothetical protein